MGIQRVLNVIMGINEKTTLEQMEEDGWRNTGQRFVDYEIFAKEEKRVFYDRSSDEIILRYDDETVRQQGDES
jgi:hypothetical protein